MTEANKVRIMEFIDEVCKEIPSEMAVTLKETVAR